METDLQTQLAVLLNSFFVENRSNTPDWILAEYLLACLAAYNKAVRARDEWYGIAPEPRLRQK
jgi:hypothetical protein